MRKLADATMHALANVLVHAFFRDVEVTGLASIPVQGPTMLVANHQNGLVDGLVLIAAMPRHPRFLGKSTLWNIVPLRPFLALAGVVPVVRATEPDGAQTSATPERSARNDEAFARCRQLLGAGGMISVFPEGISHDESSLQPLRTGAARIALGAADDGVAHVTMVPAGLVYDDKSRFRSRVLIRIGSPVPVAKAAAAYRGDPRAAVRNLTEDVAAALRTLAPDYPSWALAQRCSTIAELVVGSPRDGIDPQLSERDEVTRVLATLAADPAGSRIVERIGAQVDAYHRDLAALGLRDDQLIAGLAPWRYRGIVAWSSVRMIVAAPVSMVGVAIHALPYLLVKHLARRPDNEGMKATVKVGGCFGLFTLVYLGLAAAVGRRRGAVAALVALVAAPVSGYVAVLSSERLERTDGLAQAMHAVVRHRGRITDLGQDRARIIDDARHALGDAPVAPPRS